MYEDCEQCEYDESHYYCYNCEEVTGLMGHFDFDSSEFTCIKPDAKE